MVKLRPGSDLLADPIVALEEVAALSSDLLDCNKVEELFCALEVQLRAREEEFFPEGVAENLGGRAAQMTFRFRPRWSCALFRFFVKHGGMDSMDRIIADQEGWAIWPANCPCGFVVARAVYVQGLAAAGLFRVEGVMGVEPEQVETRATAVCPYEGTCQDEVECSLVGSGENPADGTSP